eukprot:768441-Hanusia_phi.AAC.11
MGAGLSLRRRQREDKPAQAINESGEQASKDSDTPRDEAASASGQIQLENDKLRRLESELSRRLAALEERERSLQAREQSLEIQLSSPVQHENLRQIQRNSISGERWLVDSASSSPMKEKSTPRGRYGRRNSVPTLIRSPNAKTKALARSVVDSKSIRVFIVSSMQNDVVYQLLHRAVFPRLVSDAHRRGLSLVFVDLSDILIKAAQAKDSSLDHEEKFTKEVVPVLDLMLKEMENCCLLMGILADQYGPALGSEVCTLLSAMGHDWVEDLEEASVEDMLIRKATSLDSINLELSHFYLNRVDNLSISKNYSLLGTEAFDLHDSQPVSPVQVRLCRQKIAECYKDRSLLGEIEHVVSDASICFFDDNTSLAKMIYADFRSFLDAQFPVDYQETNVKESLLSIQKPVGFEAPLQGWEPACGSGWWSGDRYFRDYQINLAYQESLEESDIFVPEEIALCLDQYKNMESAESKPNRALACIDHPNQTSVSVFLALWARNLQMHPDGNTKVIYHRCSNCGWGFRSVERELLYVLSELKHTLGILMELPSKRSVKREFQNWLTIAGKRARCVIIIDGLERLKDSAGSLLKGLWGWLPEFLPSNCKVILGVGDEEATDFMLLRHVHFSRSDSSKSGFAPPALVMNENDKLFHIVVRGFSADEAAGIYMHSLRKYLNDFNDTKVMQDLFGFDEIETVHEGDDFSVQMKNTLFKFGKSTWDKGAKNVLLYSRVFRYHARLFKDYLQFSDRNEKLGVVGSDLQQAKSHLRSIVTEKTQQDASIKSLHSLSNVDILLKIITQVETILVEQLDGDNHLRRILEFLVSSYSGMNEFSLQNSVEFDLKKEARVSKIDRCALYLQIASLLQKLKPFMICAGGYFLCEDDFREAVNKMCRREVKRIVCNPWLLLDRDSQKVDFQPTFHAREDVAEALHIYSNPEMEYSLTELICNPAFLISAYHTVYWKDFVSAWEDFVEKGSSKDLTLTLRQNGCIHWSPITFDGGTFQDDDLRLRFCILETLLIAEFLLHGLNDSANAEMLLDFKWREVEKSQKELLTGFVLPYSYLKAIIFSNKGEKERAIAILSSALDTSKSLWHTEQGMQNQYWRENCYIDGFLKLSRYRGTYLLADFYHESMMMVESQRLYESLVSVLTEYSVKFKVAKLILARIKWRIALLLRDAANVKESLEQALDAESFLQHECWEGHPEMTVINDFVTKLRRRLNFGAVEKKQLAESHVEAVDELDLLSEERVEIHDVPNLIAEFDALFRGGEYVKAQARIKSALKSIEDAPPNQHPDLWIDVSIKYSRVLTRRNLFSSALQTIEMVIQFSLKLAPRVDHVSVLEPKLDLCVLLLEMGSYDRAFELLQQFRELDLTSKLDEKHPLLARMNYALGIMYSVQGQWVKAEEQFLKSLKSRESGSNDLDDEYFSSKCALIAAYFAQEKFELAEKEIAATMMQVEDNMGKGSYHKAELNYYLGSILLLKANYRGSDHAFRETQRLLKACIGNQQSALHYLFLLTSSKLAEKSLAQRRLEEAGFVYEKLIESLKRTELDLQNSVWVSEIKERYFLFLDSLGNVEDAMIQLEEALDLRKQISGHQISSTFHLYAFYAMQEISLGRFTSAHTTMQHLEHIKAHSDLFLKSQEATLETVKAKFAFVKDVNLEIAEQHARRALLLKEEIEGIEHPSVAYAKVLLSTILIQRRKYHEADSLLRAAHGTLTITFGKASPHISDVLRVEAQMMISKFDIERVEEPLREALVNDSSTEIAAAFLEGKEEVKLPKFSNIVNIIEDLEVIGKLYILKGNFFGAYFVYRQMSSLAEYVFGSNVNHPLTAQALIGLSLTKQRRGEYVEAYDLCKRGVDMLAGMFGTRHPQVFRNTFHLLEILELAGDFAEAVDRCNQLMEAIDGNPVFSETDLYRVAAYRARYEHVMGEKFRPTRELRRLFYSLEANVGQRLVLARKSDQQINHETAHEEDESIQTNVKRQSVALQAQILLWIAELEVIAIRSSTLVMHF